MFKKINFNNVLFFILIILIIFGTYKLLKKKFNLLEGFVELTGDEIANEFVRLTNELDKDNGKIKNKFDKISSKNIKNLINICNIKIRGLIASLTLKNLKYQKVQIKYWTEIKELLEKFQNSTSSMSSGVTNRRSGVTKRRSGVTNRMSGVTSSIFGNGGNGSGDEKEDETDEEDDGSMWPF